jgi:hypothetical protein
MYANSRANLLSRIMNQYRTGAAVRFTTSIFDQTGTHLALSCILPDQKTARPGVDSETGCGSGNERTVSVEAEC